MKRLFVLLLAFINLMLIVGCDSVRREPNSKKQQRNGLTYIVNEQAPYTGIIVMKSETFFQETPFKDGKCEGIERQYEHDKLAYEATYKNNKLEGPWKGYYSNGQLMIERFYKNDELDGVCKTWFEDGQPESIQTYKNGKLDGTVKEWHKSSQLKLEGIYKEGKKEGLFQTWDYDGLKTEEVYENDILIKRTLPAENQTPLPVPDWH